MKQIEETISQKLIVYQCEACNKKYIREDLALKCEVSHVCSKEIVKYETDEAGYGRFSIRARCGCGEHCRTKYIDCSDISDDLLKDIFERAL